MVSSSPCGHCGGTGEEVSSPCSDCRGEGRVTEERAAEGMKWAPARDFARPERAEQLLEQIKKQLGGS